MQTATQTEIQRGRPRKYATEEEARLANRERARQYYQKNKEKIINGRFEKQLMRKFGPEIAAGLLQIKSE